VALRLGHLVTADRLHHVRRSQDAAVGDRRVHRRHLHRRDRLALADGEVAHRGAGVAAPRQDDPLLLAGKVDARRLAEAERLDPLGEAVGAERATDQVGADVARELEDLGDGQRLGPARLGVVDRAVVELEVDRRLNGVLGVTLPSCSAPATVTALNVEPGS